MADSTLDYPLPPTTHASSLLGLRFPDALEQAFQRDYFGKIVKYLRVISILFFVLNGLGAARSVLSGDSLAWTLVSVALMASNISLLPLTFYKNGWKIWQPCAAAAMMFGFTVVLLMLASLLAAKPFAEPHDRMAWFVVVLEIFIVGILSVRTTFPWVVLIETYLSGFSIYLTTTKLHISLLDTLWMFGSTVAFELLAALFIAFLQERLYRDAFVANYQLAQKEAAERQRRQDSENMLQVLSQAIGGIVHDLGNPLTSVRTGAQTLDLFIEDGDTDKETLKEFTSIITDGAQMLDYLRLSLMEQTRVLEGKPLPLDCKNISLRHIIEAGARYQKPKFASGRKVSVIGEDLDICVDEMKMITVFMNLIGNALKYSDGEVRITWRMNKDILLVAIMDQGQQGRGISRDQAEQLFVAFGRLDTHASVEGTGLGLLSVKKIVEAHGGQVFIEGHIDGTLTSAAFCTAQGPCLSVLDEGFCTAFVLTLPLKLTS